MERETHIVKLRGQGEEGEEERRQTRAEGDWGWRRTELTEDRVYTASSHSHVLGVRGGRRAWYALGQNIEPCCMMLCALDELSTRLPEGSQKHWSQQSLLAG